MSNQPSQPGNEPQSHNAASDLGGSTPERSEMGRPMGSTYEPMAQPPAESPSKLLIAIAATGLAIAVFGLARGMFFKPAETKAAPAARQPSPWETQQQLMRDAIETARAAQQLQREHQENMRRAIEASEYGGVPGEDW